jgi:hypothetical protein
MKGKNMLAGYLHNTTILTLILKQGLTSPAGNYSMAQKENLTNCAFFFFKSEK